MSRPERPSVLLYDWDNTLVDAWAGVAAALNATFAEFDRPLWTLEEVRARVRGSLRDTFPGMFGESWVRAGEVFYAALAGSHLEHVRPMPGIEAALAAAAAWPQGVVSNKTGPFLRAEVAHLGWGGRFGAVVGAGDAVADKPDAAPILLALGSMGRAAGPDVWYVGDTALDMRTANAAGVRAVLLGDAAHDGGVAACAPDLHVPDAEALAALLGRLA